MTSLRKFSIVLLVVAALVGLMATPAQAQVTPNCNSSSFPSQMSLGGSYTLTCAAVGGIAPYHYTYTGTLPPGMQSIDLTTQFNVYGLPSVAGTYTFTVVATDNNSNSGQQSFTVNVGTGGGGSGGGSISLTQVSPNQLTAGVTTSVILFGSGFNNNSIVYFNGNAVAPVVNSATQITANIPGSFIISGTSPTIYVRDNSTGATSVSLPMTVTGSGSGGGSLSLSSISPTSAATGGPGFTLSLFGSGFSAGTAVSFGSVCTIGTTFNSTVQLTAFIPSNCLATAGTINVSVGGSNSVQFTIGGGGSSGTISLSSVSPNTFSPGMSTTFYFSGSNFTGNTIIHFNGYSALGGFQSSNSIYATIPGNYLTTGALSVYLTDQTTGTSNTLTVSSTGSGSSGLITLSSVSPTTLTPNTQNLLSLNGTNFTQSSVVHFNGFTLTPVFQSSGFIYVTIPSTYVTSGSLPVYVTDPLYGTSGTLYVVVSGSSTGGLSLSSLQPSSIATGSQAFTLNLYGSGFSTGSLISFGSCTVGSQFISTGQLSATIPASCVATAGTLNVSVGGSNSVQFVVGGSSGGTLSVSCNPPYGPTSLGSFYQQTCSVVGGTFPYNWTVSGLPQGLIQSAYTGQNSVTISGTPSTSQSYAYVVQVNDATSQIGSLTISGTLGTGSSGFNVSSLSPSTITANSGQTTINIFGNGFTNGATAYFNGTPLGTTFVGSTQLQAVIPASYIVVSQTANITVNSAGVISNAVQLVIGSGTGTGGSLSVNCSPGIGPQAISQFFSTVCTATGGVQPYSWTTPGVPGYLTLSATTGQSITISGTPTASGPYNYTVRTTDSSSQTASLQFAGQVTGNTAGNGGIVLTSLSPTSAPLNSAQVSITANGSGFSSNSQIVFDGFPVITTFLNGSQLAAIIPAGQFTFARGAQVAVTTPGVGTSNSLTFTIGTGVSVPLTISCSPGVGPSAPNAYYAATCGVNGGTGPFNWTISSGSLPSGLTLTPNGVTAQISGFTSLNGPYSYTLQVTDSSSSPQTGTLVFAGTTGAGSGTSGGGLSLSALSPTSTAIGSPATTINISGSGFSSSTIAYFNGNSLPTTFISSGQVSAVIPASLLTQALSASITVISNGTTSNALTFTVGTVANGAGITVTCTPSAGPPTPGYNYLTTCTASGGKAPYAWTITNGQLPSGLVLQASTTNTVNISGLTFVNGLYFYALQVTDSSTPVQTAQFPFAGTIGATSGGGFAGPITSLNPTFSPVGGPQVTLTVTGSGFVNGQSTVYWSPNSGTTGTPLSTVYLSTTQLQAFVPASYVTSIGTNYVSVVTNGYGSSQQVGFFVSGAGAVSVAPSALTFTYALGGALPSAQNLSVTSSSTSIGGFTVTPSGIANNISWLLANPSTSGFPGTVSVSISPGGLAVGSYSGTVTITGYGTGSNVTIPVTLVVVGQPTLVTTPKTLSFTTGAGGVAATQTLAITANDNATIIPFTASAVANNSGSWLSVTPGSGNTAGTLTVKADATNLSAGTYNGTITVNSTGSVTSSLSIPVSLTVTTPTNITATPSSLTFNASSGGSNPAAQTVSIGVSSGSALNYTIATTTTAGGSWLSATPTSGATPGTISVSVNTSGLSSGTFNGSVVVTAAGATNSPFTIPVTMVLGNPAPVTASPASLTFNYQVGTAGPPSQTLNLSAPSGSGPLNYTIVAAVSSGGTNWLSTTPTTGTTPGTVTVNVNAGGLSAATYNGTLTITAPGAGPLTVPVTLVVAPPAATLSVSPQTLTFTASASGTAPAPQTVAVTTTNNTTVNYTVAATSTGNWLTATATGTTPGTVSVSVNATGLAAGQYTGTLSIASDGATNTPQTVQVTLNVTPPPSIIATPQSLSFFVPGDGSAPAPQSITVISSGGNTAFTSSAVAQGGNWLTATGGGQTPGNITVTVNPAGLFAGQTYNGVVSISAPGSDPSTLQVPVTLTLAPQGAVPLTVAPQSVYLTYTQGSGSDLQHVLVLNSGGGSVGFNVQGQSQTCGNWLNVITPTGSASASTPGIVGFNVNPSGLNTQTCRGRLTITDTNNNVTTVPVYMAISGSIQSILLSQTAMTFVAAANGAAPPPQPYQVLNPGSSTLNWNITTSTLSGGSWLSASPNSGTAQSLGQPGSPINVSVNPQGLAAGVYYGTVAVNASGVANNPQSITVSLTVLGAGANPPAQVVPAGIVLTVSNGTADSQTVNVTNPGSSALSYTAILVTDDGQTWLTANPTTGSIASGGTNAITVSATATGLGTGLRHGALRLAFSDGSIQTVDVQLAVAGASSGTGVRSCGSADLALEYLSPAQNFQVQARVPVPLRILVKDCSGNTLTSSNTGVDVLVGSSSTNIRLNYTGNGIWSGTWTPSSPVAAVAVTARAITLTGSGAATGLIVASGSITPSLPNAAPSVAAVLNAGSFLLPGLVAPGTMVSIFGSGLANGQSQVFSTPFPNTLQGAQFTVRGVPLSLFYASDGQVNGVLPIGLTANERDQLIVVRDTTQSAPVDLLVADTDPGIFSVNSQGTGQGAILLNGTAQIAAPAGSIPGAVTVPAKAGDTVSLFMAGLGTVSNPPADGSPATGSSLTTGTPVVTIGGVNATVPYSGLAPGNVGLYQVNVVVPQGTPTGDAVNVVVTMGNGISNTVTMAVK